MTELGVLRMVSLKGRVRVDELAVSLGVRVANVRDLVEAAVGSGYVKEMPMGFKLSPEGRQRLDSLLAEECSGIDIAQMGDIYEAFVPINGDAKAVFTAWQVRTDGRPNDHGDAAYDEDVLGRLTAIHERVLPVVEQASAWAPRARRYAQRLIIAQERYAAGDHAFVTRPIIDSYHTVWFELHEDLICWSGRTRADEAAAGRAS